MLRGYFISGKAILVHPFMPDRVKAQGQVFNFDLLHRPHQSGTGFLILLSNFSLRLILSAP